MGLQRGWAFGLCGLLGVFGLLPACTKSYLTDGVMTIKTGQEPDAWTADPVAQNLVVEMVEPTKRTTLANVPAPVTSISLGTAGPSFTIASFEATGFDAAANVVMRATSVPLEVYGFEDAHLALFVGRVGGLSRAPGDFSFAHHHPQMLAVSNAYLMISGGDEASAAVEVYNMPFWGPSVDQDPLPKVPGAWATNAGNILLIDHEGAIWVDMWTSPPTQTDAVAPGVDYTKLIGGETISAADGTQYIVGATRLTDKPTDQVLRVDRDATLHLMTLGTPRLGAAAALVNGRLLVVGGSDTGDGAEISTTDGTGFTPLPFPADARIGAAVVAQDASTALLAGGRDPASDEIAGFRTMDLDCAESCAQVEIPKADFAFDRPRLFALSTGQLVAVGEDPTTQELHLFTFDTGIGHALTEFPLRVPRTAASAFLLPNGQVGVFGGDAVADQSPVKNLELFFPLP